MTVARLIELLEWAKDQVGDDAPVTIQSEGGAFVLRMVPEESESETGLDVRVTLNGK